MDHLLTIPQCQIAHFKDTYPQIKVHPLPIDIVGYQMNLYWDQQSPMNTKSYGVRAKYCSL